MAHDPQNCPQCNDQSCPLCVAFAALPPNFTSTNCTDCMDESCPKCLAYNGQPVPAPAPQPPAPQPPAQPAQPAQQPPVVAGPGAWTKFTTWLAASWLGQKWANRPGWKPTLVVLLLVLACFFLGRMTNFMGYGPLELASANDESEEEKTAREALEAERDAAKDEVTRLEGEETRLKAEVENLTQQLANRGPERAPDAAPDGNNPGSGSGGGNGRNNPGSGSGGNNPGTNLPAPTAAQLTLSLELVRWQERRVHYRQLHRTNTRTPASAELNSAEDALEAVCLRVLQPNASPTLLVELWRAEKAFLQHRMSGERDQNLLAMERAFLAAIDALLTQGASDDRVRTWLRAMRAYHIAAG